MITVLLVISQLGCAANEDNKKKVQRCQGDRVILQMLGTRGPELWDQQASSSYLLWLNSRARLIIDAGAGSLQNFEASHAKYKDLSAILFTHFHIDHSADLINYLKGGFFTNRDKDLLIIGPDGNHLVSSADGFIEKLIGKKGVYPYFSDLIDQSPSSYKLIPKTIPWSLQNLTVRSVYEDDTMTVKAVSTHHGPIPSLAYRIEAAGCVISFTGDMSGKLNGVPKLVENSDILVAHNAIPESATGVAANLHMKPSYIGQMATKARVKKLLLTHLMRRTVDKKEETLQVIRQTYKGLVVFPEDLQLFHP